MKRSKSLILLLILASILMSILLIGCRSNYHTRAITTKQETNEKEQEIPYAKFEDCLYVWEDEKNPLLVDGYVKLSENVENQSYYYDKTDIKILEKKANYPDVVEDSDSKIKKAIEADNKRQKDMFDAQVVEALKSANSNAQGVNPNSNKQVNSIKPYEFDNSWQVIRNDEKMLTIVRSIYSYAGGAHPNLYKEVTSYDPVEGKKLTIGSITTDEKRFRQFVEDALNTYVLVNKCSDYLFGENGYKEAFKNWDKNWWILDGDLFVGFNTYDIAPYVAGPLVIPIDITNARELLNEYGEGLFN